MAKKTENIINLLKEKGVPVDIYTSPAKEISKQVRWAKRNFPELHFNHVAPGVYLVDVVEFEKVFNSFINFRQMQTSEKAILMKELNDKMKKEKIDGIRDNRGKLIEQAVEPEETDSIVKTRKTRSLVPVGKAKESAKAAKKAAKNGTTDEETSAQTKQSAKAAKKAAKEAAALVEEQVVVKEE